MDRAFIRALAQDGLARIDLGEQGRALCDQVIADTDPYFEQGVVRVQDAWLRSRAIRTLADSAEIKRLLGLAYGRPPYPFQTLNFRKGSQQEVHSDAVHFHCEPERFMCGVWIALEDITPQSGPLLYRPGSHRLPVLTMREAGVEQGEPRPSDYARVYLPALERRLEDAQAPVRTVLPRRGEAVVWAANLAHGGSPVLDPASTRRSLVVHYYFKGCLPYTPMTSDVEAGRLNVRLPTNIATGGVEWPRRGRAPKMPNARQLVETLTRLALRRVVTF